jgi:hypothetical protein
VVPSAPKRLPLTPSATFGMPRPPQVSTLGSSQNLKRVVRRKKAKWGVPKSVQKRVDAFTACMDDRVTAHNRSAYAICVRPTPSVP